MSTKVVAEALPPPAKARRPVKVKKSVTEPVAESASVEVLVTEAPAPEAPAPVVEVVAEAPAPVAVEAPVEPPAEQSPSFGILLAEMQQIAKEASDAAEAAKEPQTTTAELNELRKQWAVRPIVYNYVKKGFMDMVRNPISVAALVLIAVLSFCFGGGCSSSSKDVRGEASNVKLSGNTVSGTTANGDYFSLTLPGDLVISTKEEQAIEEAHRAAAQTTALAELQGIALKAQQEAYAEAVSRANVARERADSVVAKVREDASKLSAEKIAEYLKSNAGGVSVSVAEKPQPKPTPAVAKPNKSA